MRRFSVIFLLFALTATGFSSTQTSPNASMNAFWDKFKGAVTKGDKEAVFRMSQLPVDLGYGMRDIKTKAQFMRNFKYLFANETDAAKCFQTAQPEVDRQRPKEFIVGCPFKEFPGEEPFVYTFKLTRLGWRFVGFENINE